jgi:hypothetical protein
VWNETGEDESVRCTECNTDIEEGCPHVLLVADVTFGTCEGGEAFEFWEDYCSQVQKVFAQYLREKARPRWEKTEVEYLWEQLHKDIIDQPEEPRLPGSELIDLMAEVLSEADGKDIGNVMSLSGGRCQSKLRVMFASDPKATCRRAVAILDRWLIPKKPRRGKR